jgi:DNA-binding transcriptional ArsR family regulator
VDALQALGDPVRLGIVESLARHPAPVGVLAEQFPISRPAVSRHLRLLKEAGLVDSVVDGTRRVYRVRPEGVAALREYMDQLWQEASARYTLVAENITREGE